MGSSSRAVPAPTTIASAPARRRCTSARAASPVIHLEVPSLAAVFPSRLDGHLQRDERAAGRDVPVEASFSRWHSSASTSETTSIPAARSRATPAPSTTGFGSPAPTTTRATPASIRASRAGAGPAVVIARLERADERSRRGHGHRPRRAPSTSACGGPGSLVPALADDGTVAQRRRRRPSGSGRRGPSHAPRARGPARMYVRRRPRRSPSFRGFGGGTEAHGSTGRARRGGAVTPVSSHPDFHGRSRNPPGPPAAGGRGVADCHRRWGIRTPPRKQAVRAASIRSATRQTGPAAGSGTQAVRGRSRRCEPGSRLANCFISVATATASP